jgi:hypothetical protein
MPAKIPAHIREQQINDLPNISFVRWVDGSYMNHKSKATVRCAIDGFEWPASVNSLINHGKGCPECSGKRHWTAEERERQINELPNILFVRWSTGYRGAFSKTIVRCAIDGFEWCATIDNILNKGSGCPECSGKRRWTSAEREQQINALPNISFSHWEGEYRGAHSKAVCRCVARAHLWAATVSSLIHRGSRCPQCAESGYSTAKPGTLYVLRSECGAMVKIGISNDYQTRHTTLKRKTPFEWHCVELLHGDGGVISALEKKLHGLTEPVAFTEKFDGFTEWRKWDNRLPSWIAQCREKIEAP